MVLYRRQRTSVRKQAQIEPIDKGIDVSPLLDVFSKEMQRVAQNNFRLGSAIALNTALNQAYEAYPDDATKFNELATSIIDKTTADMPNEVRDQAMDAFAVKRLGYLNKIATNKTMQQDQEQKSNVQQSLDLSMQSYNENLQNMYMSTALRDDNAVSLSRLGADNNLLAQKEIAESRTISGEMIVDKKTYNSIENGQYGHVDAFKYAVRNLGYDEAEAYNAEVFADRAAFMKKTGINDTTYDEMDRFIRGQLRQNKKDKDAKIKSQAEFTAIRAMNERDPELWQQIMDSPDTPDSMKKSLKQINKIYERPASTKAVEDAYLLEKAIFSATESLSAGSDPDGLDKEKAMAKWVDLYGRMAQSSRIEEGEQEEIMDLGIKSLVDSEFGEEIRSIALEEDMLGQYLRKNLASEAVEKIGIAPVEGLAESQEKLKSARNVLEVNARRKAHAWTQDIIAAGMRGDIRSMQDLKRTANRDIMLAANADKIDNAELTRLEKARENNEPAIFTYANKNFEFLGYDNKGMPIFKDMK